MTVGPWKPISLHAYSTRIVEVDIRSKISKNLDVNLTVDFALSAQIPGVASVVLKDSQGVRIADESYIKSNSKHFRASFRFSPGSLELWYPIGYGKQPIYTVEIDAIDEVGGNVKYYFSQVDVMLLVDCSEEISWTWRFRRSHLGELRLFRRRLLTRKA